MKPQSLIPFSAFLFLLLFQNISHADDKYNKESTSTLQLGLGKADILANPTTQSSTLNLQDFFINDELIYINTSSCSNGMGSSSPCVPFIRDFITEEHSINKKCLKYKKPQRVIQYLVLEIPFGTLHVKQIPILNF